MRWSGHWRRFGRRGLSAAKRAESRSGLSEIVGSSGSDVRVLRVASAPKAGSKAASRWPFQVAGETEVCKRTRRGRQARARSSRWPTAHRRPGRRVPARGQWIRRRRKALRARRTNMGAPAHGRRRQGGGTVARNCGGGDQGEREREKERESCLPRGT